MALQCSVACSKHCRLVLVSVLSCASHCIPEHDCLLRQILCCVALWRIQNACRFASQSWSLRVQVVREDSQMRQQARVRDEADPFARLHPGRRLFLPSLSPDGDDCTEGQSEAHAYAHAYVISPYCMHVSAKWLTGCCGSEIDAWNFKELGINHVQRSRIHRSGNLQWHTTVLKPATLCVQERCPQMGRPAPAAGPTPWIYPWAAAGPGIQQWCWTPRA